MCYFITMSQFCLTLTSRSKKGGRTESHLHRHGSNLSCASPETNSHRDLVVSGMASSKSRAFTQKLLYSLSRHSQKKSESLRMEKASRITESSHEPNTTVLTTEPYPQVPHTHTELLNSSRAPLHILWDKESSSMDHAILILCGLILFSAAGTGCLLAIG